MLEINTEIKVSVSFFRQFFEICIRILVGSTSVFMFTFTVVLVFVFFTYEFPFFLQICNLRLGIVFLRNSRKL